MMDGNTWADFGSSAGNEENDDDDWADFGGFEVNFFSCTCKFSRLMLHIKFVNR